MLITLPSDECLRPVEHARPEQVPDGDADDREPGVVVAQDRLRGRGSLAIVALVRCILATS